MKKEYVIPECMVYVLPNRSLCQTSLKINKTDTFSDSSQGFYSKGYAGGVEDDSPIDLWAEEEK